MIFYFFSKLHASPLTRRFTSRIIVFTNPSFIPGLHKRSNFPYLISPISFPIPHIQHPISNI
ncbi:hypothetical protein B0I18_108171 [Taibaiella chishuiensis]|uniref:Uncharacterized protein n=1 Tax=Taibaiella chishuiensis TaxID=1434707 RepID=A0A2P8CZP6_9BACT|nr:hypothetical protein B0I18_108171 [Taibaiella chishuiensis]